MPQVNTYQAAQAVYSVDSDPTSATYGEPLVRMGTATNPTQVKAASYTSLGDQNITSLAASTALTVPGGATVAFVQNTGAGVVRYRFSGTPTPSVGHQLAAGATVTVDDGNAGLAAFRAIDGSGTNSIYVSYFS